MKYVILTSPQYHGGEITDEKFYCNIDMISEVLPHDMTACRGDGDGWNSKIIMSNGSKYNIVETPERVIELIAAAELS